MRYRGPVAQAAKLPTAYGAPDGGRPLGVSCATPSVAARPVVTRSK
jgi:hypothetical protein